MLTQDIKIINKLGLHARAASKFVTVASRFEATVTVRRDNKHANGKSIMGIMMLAAGKGTQLTLEIDGPDEQAALEAIVTLVEDRFDEAE